MHTNPLLLHPILVDSNAKSHKLLANLMRRMQNLTIINSTFPADISKQLLYKCGLRVHPIGHFTFYAGCDIR